MVDFTRRDRQPDFPRLDLHATQILGGAQCLYGGELSSVGGDALQSGQVVTVLLLHQHSGDQQHANPRR